MKINFDEIRKLVPEERVKTLRELINKLRDEVKKQEQNIQQAEQLLQLAQEEQDARAIVRDETSIDTATESEEEPVTLEQHAAQAPRQELERVVRGNQPSYHQIAERPVHELYQELRSIYDREAATGVETDQDRERIYQLQRGLAEKRKDIEQGTYKPGDKAEHLMSAAEQMVKKMYHGTVQEDYH